MADQRYRHMPHKRYRVHRKLGQYREGRVRRQRGDPDLAQPSDVSLEEDEMREVGEKGERGV